mmetsp:Transcript_95397/g.269561  ORF Transcript_95397/g.269561 Transcript_95397/m.269561 type:complete len:521 (+) Transcript_95397:109-1671(+)
MKVQVTVRVSSKDGVNSTVDLVVGATDTVGSLKDRVAGLQLIPFPDHDLMLDGEVLDLGQRLADCGLREPGALDLVVRASEATLAQQLSELLQARDLSCDELGLLYCYKHGVSVGQALKLLGHDAKLPDFLRQHKQFQLDKNTVAIVRDDTVLKPFSVAVEIEQIIKDSGGSMEIKDLCSKFTRKFNVSLASLVGMKPAEFLAKERELFALAGRGCVALRAAAQPELLPERPSEAPGGAAENQQYLELHERISGRALSSRLSQALSEVQDAVSKASFLSVERVVRGGSVGKGTAIAGASDAELVFFLRGLPPNGHERWLPPLLRAAAAVLGEQLPQLEAACLEDHVLVRGRGLQVELRFSPCFESYARAVQALGEQGPEARRFFTASLAEQRVQFISRQPGPVRATIRLLKWWRDQQQWSAGLVRPRDEVLELMAVYSAVQTRPADQRQAVANVMSLLSRFDELRIVWSNFYSKSDVWAPLLNQRPLLMDPVNPFVNIADPQVFDPRELMSAAATTRFFC